MPLTPPTIRVAAAALMIMTCLLTACDGGGEKAPDDAREHEESGESAAPSNRVDIPPAVRQNLGITFATAQRRAVSRTVRVPGRFELLPDAAREHRTMLDGRVQLLVQQYQRVEAGDLLYRIESPDWRGVQREIADADNAILSAHAVRDTIGPLREAHAAHERSLEESVRLWNERVTQLDAVRAAGGGKAEEQAQSRAMLSAARAELADVLEKDAELEARQREADAQLEGATVRRELLLSGAATLTGVPVERLVSSVEGAAAPLWRTIDAPEVRAGAAGIVDSLAVTTGAWVEQGSSVMTVLQPDRLRFRAAALQSDLWRMRPGQSASVVHPSRLNDSLAPAELKGVIAIAQTADPDGRTIDVIITLDSVAAWARAGVTAYAEIVVDADPSAPPRAPDLAIPLSAVARDGLTPVIFRRDPKNPDKAIRMEADLGADDGRWVIVRSGLGENDQVVLDGVYQLMLATSGSAAKGGHFHSDGSFHEGAD